MSERTDQNPRVDSGSRNDPLAELARIVAGENPIEVVTPTHVANTNQPITGMEAETQVDFSADLASEALPGIAPSEAPAQAPIGAPDELLAVDDFDLEASLESQLMQEFDVADAIDTPVATTAGADIPRLQEVETLAEEFVSKTSVTDAVAAATPAPYDDYDVTREFASEAVPSHLTHAESSAAYSEVPPLDPVVEIPKTGGFVAEGVPADLGDDFDAKFEEIAQQAAAVDDLHFTAQDGDGGLNLEAEFESAFASELDQNDILPETTTSFVAPPISEFETPYAGNEATGPEHLSDPAMFDEAAPANDLGVAASPPMGRSGFKMAALALGVALLVGFAAVGYGFFSNDGGDGDPIVVMADPGDIKVKPDDRGGVVIANQDKASYAEISGNKEEGNQDRLFSGTETANEPPQVSALEPKFEERLTPGSDVSPEKPAAIAPRRVRTFTVKPDGTILTPEPEPLLTATSALGESGASRSLTALQPTETPVADTAVNDPVVAPRQVETVRVEPPVSVEAAPVIVAEPQQVAVVEAPAEIVNIAPEPIDGAIAASGNIAVPEQSPLPKPIKVAAPEPSRTVAEPRFSGQNDAPVQLASTPPATPVQTSASSSPWAIQISSQRSREAADSSYKNLLRRFPSLLNGRSFDIREAQVSGKGTFFRVRIQADSKQGASNFCTQFKSSGGSCFITR